MRTVLFPVLLLLAACIDFDALEREACERRGVCEHAPAVAACEPCTEHADCDTPDSFCVTEPGGGFCGVPCSRSVGDCGPDQTCTHMQVGDRSGFVCRPASGRLCDGGIL